MTATLLKVALSASEGMARSPDNTHDAESPHTQAIPSLALRADCEGVGP